MFKPKVHISREYYGNIPYVCCKLLRRSWVEITPGRNIESCPYGGIRHVLHMPAWDIHTATFSVISLCICCWSSRLNHPHELEVLWCVKSHGLGTEVVDAVVRPVRLGKGLILLSKLGVKCAVLRVGCFSSCLPCFVQNTSVSAEVLWKWQ